MTLALAFLLGLGSLDTQNALTVSSPKTVADSKAPQAEPPLKVKSLSYSNFEREDLTKPFETPRSRSLIEWKPMPLVLSQSIIA